MKKIYLSLCMAALLGVKVNAQTQRFQIIEEFTGENCGPCAGTNPVFDAAWEIPENESKVTVIKYQGDIPSAGPVLYQQTKTDVDSRMGYYSISSHPDMVHDGAFNAGHPIDFEQQWVDDRYTVTSPFQFNLTHSFDATNTNIIITGTITATEAVTYSANQLKQHIVIIEKMIEFASPPGSNGETVFKHVVRKMLPNASGTTLPSVWTVGQSVNINIVAPIPSFIYKLSEVAVVGFIQNNTGKVIQQGVITQAVDPGMDVSITSIENLSAYSCGSTINPTINIQNNGSVALTSLDVNYKINNGPTAVYNWTGNIADGATGAINLPAIIVSTTGLTSLTCTIGSPNGGIDAASNNNSATKEFIKTNGSGVVNQVAENFSGVFPPPNWYINNITGGYTWEKRSGNGAPAPSSRLLFYDIPTGDVDEFYLPSLNLNGVQGSLVMSFSVAHAQYGSSSDKLEVKVSSDCGATWQTLYNKAGSALATVAATTSSYAALAAQFRTETVNLSTYVGQPQVLVKFVGTSDYGNNVFIDNININPFTPPTISNNNVMFCENVVLPADTLDKLVTVPSTYTKNWYTTPTGGVASGTAPIVSTTPTGVTTYYVSTTDGVLESGRLPLVVTVVAGAPATPVIGSASIQYCNNAMANSLTPNGNNYVWYTDAVTTAGMATLITPSTSAAGTTTYYLAEKNACGESATRASFDVIVDAPVSVPTTTPLTYCQFTTASSLTATGTGLKWYTTAVGGTASSAAYTPSTAIVGTITYYVSQTISGCESPRVGLAVTTKVASTIPTANGSSYCSSETPSALTATGTNLMWYTTASSTTGSATAPTLSGLSQGVNNYYVTQNANGCESSKAVVSVVIKPSPATPVVNTEDLYCVGTGDFELVATGTSILWYTTATLGTGSSTNPVVILDGAKTELYYATQTVAGCESIRKEVTIIVDECTGIEEISLNNTLVVSPNPATTQLTVNYLSKENNNAKLFITNILGTQVFENENVKVVEGANKLEINNIDFANGIYFVNLELNNEVITKKIIINK